MYYMINKQQPKIKASNIAWGLLAIAALTCVYIIIDHYDLIIAGLK